MNRLLPRVARGRGRARARYRAVRYAAVLALVGSLLAPGSAAAQQDDGGATGAQATATTHVGNTGQPALSGATTVGNHWIGTAFTTGSRSGGYTLGEIDVRIGDWGGNAAHFSANIYSTTSAGLPDSQLYTLNNPSSPTNNAVNTFTAPADATLDASTTYALVLKASSSNPVTVSGTNSDNEDAGAEAGWSIANNRVNSNNSGTSWGTDARVLMFAVKVPPVPLPVVTSATVDGTTLAITFDKNLDDTSVPSVADFLVITMGDQIGVNEVAVSDATVTLTLGSSARAGDTIRLYYTKPSSGALRGSDGTEVESFSRQAVTNNTDSERPEITDVSLVSQPRLAGTQGGSNDTYGQNQPIVVDVTWDQDVTWNVSATGADIRVRLDIGGTTKVASLATGGENSGTARTLRFRYTVESGLSDTDGVEVAQAGGGNVVLLISGATLKNANGRNAKRTHDGLGAQANHKVNSTTGAANDPGNSAPTFVGSLDSVNAPPGTFVSIHVIQLGVGGATEGFSDPDGDPLTFTFSEEPSGTYLFGFPSWASSNSRLWVWTKPNCILANRLSTLPEKNELGFRPLVVVHTITATDPDGASVSTTVEASTGAQCGLFASAEVSGTSLTVTLDEAAKPPDYAPKDEVFTPAEFEVKVDGTAVALADADPVTVSGSTITLALAEPVPAGRTATVSYAPGEFPGAVAFTDQAVTVTTVPDAAPTAVSINGRLLSLTFNQDITVALDNSNRQPGTIGANQSAEQRLRYAFSVDGLRFNGVRLWNVSPESISVTGTTLSMMMSPAVQALPGSTDVSVRYDADGAAAVGVALRGSDGRAVESFSWNGVTNNTTGTVRPLLTGAQVAGTELTLSFDRALDNSSAPAGQRFAVAVDPVDWYGETRRIQGTGTATVSGQTVTVALASAVEQGEYAWAYWFGSDTNPLRAASAGPQVDAIHGFGATVLDRTAPRMVQGIVNGTKVTLYYDEALDTGSTPATSDFTVNAGDPAVSQTVSSVVVNPNAVTLTLASSVADLGTTVAYTAGTNPIQDTLGNDAASIPAQFVRNVGANDLGKPQIGEASGEGLVLTLTFSRAIDPASLPPATAFTVSNQPPYQSQDVVGVSVVGSNVLLHLNPGMHACALDLTVSYTKPATGALRNLWGTEADAFSAVAVANPNENRCGRTVVTKASMGQSGGPSGTGSRQMSVQFDRPLSPNPRSAPKKEYFTVTSGPAGASAPVEVENVELRDQLTELLLTLSRPLGDGERATLGYRPPPSDRGLTDTDGKFVAEFSVQVEAPAPPTRPQISGVSLVSAPALDVDGDGAAETYGSGEQVVVEVTWDQDVTWDVSATGAELRMRLDVGGTRRLARFEGGGAVSGTGRSLRFSYTVADGDTDTDGVVAVPARGGDLVIRHGGATLRNAAGLNAEIRHSGLAAGAGHQVNGTESIQVDAPVPVTRPKISAVSLVSAPALDLDGDGAAETYGAGEQVVVEVTWDQDVTWDVSATGAELRMRLDVGGTRRLARFEGGGAVSGTGRSLRFSYTVADGDVDTDGVVAVPARGGDLVIRHGGATLRNAAGLNAEIRHSGLAAGAGHQVNGTATEPAGLSTGRR